MASCDPTKPECLSNADNETFEANDSDPNWNRRNGLLPIIITMFGILAMFLAGLGLYAVKAHMVATRTREIGVRMALGASRRSVLALVFRQNGVSILVGLVLGILLAIGLTSLIRGALYGISTVDPLSIGATVLVLATVSLLAGCVPACRAVRIDPMEALRVE